ncbi:ATP binding [Ascochyta rabiei]|uniref:ATP binding n=1 Tax=Didymella rabiei TaxID=5454 RepID=A0A163CEH4_DIDRA|nr:ATP binding [Ascochyta rabiei]
MSAPAHNGPAHVRNSPFARGSGSAAAPSPGPTPRPLSIGHQPHPHTEAKMAHARHQSLTHLSSPPLGRSDSRLRSDSNRSSVPIGTFAPQFISEDSPDMARPGGIVEGENDFSGKRYVWLRDPKTAFVRGWVVEHLAGGRLLVQCDDGTQQDVDEDAVDKVNPAKFDKAGDMAELTHLNEPSVIHNLHMRYQADLIYTYSGLFLVTVNPYCPLPIYTREYINMYRGRGREETKPHIFAMADEAFRNLVDEGTNQSILVTGESGAGKTENTKKVIQYLAAVANSDTPRAKSGAKNLTNLSEQILRANPILEAFGNAQTVRNNNSSRFGKFIRIEFSRAGQIAGAYIDWYLLEKSRVVKLNPNERNYHIFYQLLRGADPTMKQDFLLDSKDTEDFDYTKHGNDAISGVSDRDEWNTLIEAFHVMKFTEKEQAGILRTVAAVLHLGNIKATKESRRADQATLDSNAEAQARKVCQLLGVSADDFLKALLHPRVKAGREWVEKVQTPEQVNLALDALAKGIYERGFGDLVDRINRQLDQTGSGGDDSHFIGVLDIAGFEIFDENSFEQLCINYTNEKLQQFFNHHMFVLEQEEYAREQIEWKFIDFGRDLQPTIDLIELPNPIGIFSCLDEDSVMPKATDVSFTEKLHSLWDRKSNKYKRSLLTQGFVLTHYAAEVEYSTEGWLEKNKDPLNDNVTRLLAASSDKQIANLFADCADPDDEVGGTRSRVKKGLFRTVAQRHKEQLSTLMNQLHSTHPHFVRCILPNHKKRPKQFSAPLVLDQLRCNGVLEGIRIARTGFPNRLTFVEFRQRYEVLCKDIPKGYLEGQLVAKMILEKLGMDKALYRVGITKVFFRAGVLAELEDQRDALIRDIMIQFQSAARGFTQRRIAHKRLYRAEATRIVQKNFQVYLDLQSNPWWRLFVRMRPMLGATRQAAEVKKRDEMILQLEDKMQQEAAERQRVEDDRRRAESDMQKIQKTLESERALALDKEEIFKRLQFREAELAEKLQGAIEDQDQLEDQLDALMEAKKKTEEQAEIWRKELEQAGQIIGNLETEKQDLEEQLARLDQQLQELEAAQSKRSLAEESMSQEVKMLQSHLSLKERKLQELESKLLTTEQDLDIKLAASDKEVQASKEQIKELLEDNRQVRQQISDLSSTSTSYEDLVRRKESELAILKADLKKYESDRQTFDAEKQTLASKHDDLQSRLREANAELEAMRSQKQQSDREAADAKRLLEDRETEDAQSKLLQEQIELLKSEMFEVQKELSRERQSRDDVEMLGEHKYDTLKRDFDALNDSKITIEKEMYAQQDVLRRATETRTAHEQERKEYQAELRNLREQYLKLQEDKMDADAEAERTQSRLALEKQAARQEELNFKDQQLDQLEAERDDLAEQVHSLTQMLADAEGFRERNDQQKERLERELVTVKGRLTASENDNRALLNKVQQKNLDIARTNSRAGETQRSKIMQLTNEKSKFEEDNKRLYRQLEDAQVSIASMEKQKEKLELTLEDLNHEINREAKSNRTAEKASSTVNLQLADVNRKLETERQLRTQAQANTRAVQAALDNNNRELEECHNQLMLLRKVFDPESAEVAISYDAAKPQISKAVDVAERLEAANQALRVATERYNRAEAQLDDLRERHEGEINDLDTRHANSKRALLEEMNSSQVNQANANRSPTHRSNATNDSARSDRTVDTVAFNNRMDMAAELELAQNQLQMSEMRNAHLQGQLDQSPARNNSWQEESPSMRRVQKLERENFRLHDMLDDSAKKVSSLEYNLRSGQLSYQEVQTKSHEELFELLNSQEQSRKSIVQAHNNAINELADAKTAFDDIKQMKTALEAELREVSAELDEYASEREQEQANHNQLLQEFADLQIRLDDETSTLLDVQSSLSLYKSRADEYFNKLEQAEIAVLKASRAEQFARTQAREAEETCATFMAERKEMDGMVEGFQRQVQQYEERVEDLSTDLQAALQAKKRLQNELEDYRSQHAHDIEDGETSLEQTRKKYQTELSTLTNELDQERETIIYIREENGRLREEIEEMRSKWDDEVLNSSTWAKEKNRLEMTLHVVSNSRDEAANAHNEAQSKIVNLLSQVRNLRTNVDDLAAERDSAIEEKKRLETRLQEAADRLDDLSRSESPAMRNAAAYDRELLELKSGLAQQEDIAAAAVGKMRRAEALAQELQKDIIAEREANVQLHKEKGLVGKNLKDLQLRLVDLETKGYSGSAGKDVRFLHGRIQELEKALEDSESTRLSDSRAVRNVDRTVKDLQSQIERREKQNASVTEDLNKARDKISSLLSTIDELQSSDSGNQLAAKRAERELREEREKSVKLERELENHKNLRVERRSQLGVPGIAASDAGDARSRRGSSIGLLMGGEMGEAAPGEKKFGSFRSGLRRVSGQKGFFPYFRREVEEDVGGPVTTLKEEMKKQEGTVAAVKPRALVIAGAGMRRKHSYDTGVGLLEDIEEVESVLEKDSVLNQAFLGEDYEENEEEQGEDETLVEVDGELYKEKQVEIDVTDSEPETDNESLAEPQEDGCGVKRKRTIRVVIRSRAFI